MNRQQISNYKLESIKIYDLFLPKISISNQETWSSVAQLVYYVGYCLQDLKIGVKFSDMVKTFLFLASSK
jgi:hypothetical protein